MTGDPTEVAAGEGEAASCDPLDERLADLAALVRCGEVGGDVHARRAAAAIRAWFTCAACEPLDAALGLRSRGGRSPAIALRQAERDRMLRRLHRARWPAAAPSDAAREMAAAWAKYETDRWPREQSQLDAPAGELAGPFWRLMRSGHKPLGAKRLAAILAAADAEFQWPV